MGSNYINFLDIKAKNTAENCIEYDLVLSDGQNTEHGYADVSWSSSMPDIISVSGKVTPPARDTAVTVTAHLTYQTDPTLRFDEEFLLTVLGEKDDKTATEKAISRLQLPVTTQGRDITLPKTGYGCSVVWKSLTPELIDNSGKIVSSDFGKTARILATVSRGGKSSSTEFSVLIEKKLPTVFVVGDSTASVYKHTGVENRFPQTGWAQFFDKYFDPEKVRVCDYALSGRSSLSFRKEPNFEKLTQNISEGDYLIIQFGHNDSKDDPLRYTAVSGGINDNGSYKNSLMKFIKLATDSGANPIIATSISRRFLSDESLEVYVNAARELAEELSLPLIDMYKRTNDRINEIGLDAARDIYLFLAPEDKRFQSNPEFRSSQYYKNGAQDCSHLNIYGADYIASLACEELKRIAHPLCEAFSGYEPKPLPKYEE